MVHVFSDEIILPHKIEKVFDFFSIAENLGKITPPWLKFEIKSSLPIEMQTGTQIDYRIKLRNIPMDWRTEITAWDPPNMFQDTQIKGPYVLWRHTHTFEQLSDETTLVRDHVEYMSPGWVFEPIITKLFVKNEVRRIFEYRHQILRQKFS